MIRREGSAYAGRGDRCIGNIGAGTTTVVVSESRPFVLLPRRCAPIEKSTPRSTGRPLSARRRARVKGRTRCTVPRSHSRRPLGPRKTTSTFLPRHSHTLARAPRTFSAFPAHVARFLPTRTHARWSLILHNCIFYCSYQTSLTIGHFICKLPKNNAANVCAILEGAESGR